MNPDKTITFFADTTAIPLDNVEPQFSCEQVVRYDNILTRCTPLLEDFRKFEGLFLRQQISATVTGIEDLINQGIVPFISLMREIVNYSCLSISSQNLKEVVINHEKFVLLFIMQISFQSRNLPEAYFGNKTDSFNIKKNKAVLGFEQIADQMIMLQNCLKNLNLSQEDDHAWQVLVKSIKELESGAIDMEPFYKTELEKFAHTIQQMIDTLFQESLKSEWSKHWPKKQ